MKDEARTEFETLAAEGFAAGAARRFMGELHGVPGRSVRVLGDAERAAELYAFLAPYDGRNIVAGPNVACAGAVGAPSRHACGDDAALAGRGASFRGGAGNECAAGRAAVARAHPLPVRADAARSWPAGGSQRAVGLLDEALETARALGMNALAERAAALRDAAAVPAPRERYPAGLSRREVDVLQLIAVGKGNREIAERLFVSPNTVANHVRSILAKTNSANRTEAAAFAVRTRSSSSSGLPAIRTSRA